MESGSLAVLASLHDDDDEDEDEEENDEEIEVPPAQPEINPAQEEPVSRPPTSETSSEPPTDPSFHEAAGLAASILVSRETPTASQPPDEASVEPRSRSVEAEAGPKEGQPSNLSTGPT
jgi:hypothetical protein